MGELEDTGRRVGMFMSISTLGAIAGPPISGALSTATGGYYGAGYYAGAFIKPAVLESTLILSRWHHYMLCYHATCVATLLPRKPLGQVLNEHKLDLLVKRM